MSESIFGNSSAAKPEGLPSNLHISAYMVATGVTPSNSIPSAWFPICENSLSDFLSGRYGVVISRITLYYKDVSGRSQTLNGHAIVPYENGTAFDITAFTTESGGTREIGYLRLNSAKKCLDFQSNTVNVNLVEIDGFYISQGLIPVRNVTLLNLELLRKSLLVSLVCPVMGRPIMDAITLFQCASLMASSKGGIIVFSGNATQGTSTPKSSKVTFECQNIGLALCKGTANFSSRVGTYDWELCVRGDYTSIKPIADGSGVSASLEVLINASGITITSYSAASLSTCAIVCLQNPS